MQMFLDEFTKASQASIVSGEEKKKKRVFDLNLVIFLLKTWA